ncbi:MAG TPA: sigma-70 family RNA polymerase sigma factor [Blastocatellia bacterium]|nr:sigma-70 family RNA polymerase sigma factor [Blastocatellia bacterium]
MSQQRANEESELALLRRVADKDQDAFRQLYTRYHKRLFAYLLKFLSQPETAEEVLDDVMFEVWRQAAKFKGESKLATWIFGIAHHQAMNALRRQGSTKVVELAEVNEPLASPDNPHTEAEQSHLREKIKTALAQLSADHRAVLELTFYHGFSYLEIAKIVQCPVNTVKTRMFHAKRQLQAWLQKMGLSR